VFGRAVTYSQQDSQTTPYDQTPHSQHFADLPIFRLDQTLPEMIAIFKHRQAGQTWTSQWQRFTMGNAFLKQVYDLPSSFLLV
jgi:hypothetical protein